MLCHKDPFFIIDKGSRHNIAQDMVAVCGNLLLGRVVEVHSWYSKIMPITHVACHVPVVCATSRAHGVFHGDKLDFVSHLEPLVLDEFVLTSGDGLIYPQGLAIGRIKHIELDERGFLYNVQIALHETNNIVYCSLVSKHMQHD